MTRFEYKILRGANWNLDESRDDLLAELNIQGGNGWELVAVLQSWFYFKRQISDDPHRPWPTHRERIGKDIDTGVGGSELS